MKQFILLFFLLPALTKAQDTLILRSGEVIACKIKMVTPQIISYISSELDDRVIPLNEIKKQIIHSNVIMKKGDVVLYGDKNSEGSGFVWNKTDSITKTKNQIYSDTKMFIAETWKSAKNVIQNDDKEGGMILVRGASVQSQFFQLNDHTWTYFYHVKFYMKENKFKIVIDNVTCESAICGAYNWPLLQPNDGEYPGYVKTSLSEDRYQELMTSLKNELQSIYYGYLKYIKTPSASIEDW
jgi:hypothetical protein